MHGTCGEANKLEAGWLLSRNRARQARHIVGAFMVASPGRLR